MSDIEYYQILFVIEFYCISDFAEKFIYTFKYIYCDFATIHFESHIPIDV